MKVTKNLKPREREEKTSTCTSEIVMPDQFVMNIAVRECRLESTSQHRRLVRILAACRY